MFTKYFEAGLSPIPVYRNGKNPVIVQWQKYCHELPTPELIEEWETKYRDFNIGLCCGPASGIIVLDIDSDKLKDRCPQSPIVRKGMKGEARVFRYSESITSRSYPGLDILSSGRQFLVPPSIHPETGKPYVWITPDNLLDFDLKELPVLDLGFLSTLDFSANEIRAEGRNNKLKDIVTSMRGRGEPEEKIIKEIYEWDLAYHSPRLFTDPKENYRASSESDAKRNAWLFVTNVTRSLIQKGIGYIEDSTPIIITPDEIPEGHIVEEFPEPEGLLQDVSRLIVKSSERIMPTLALGGAIALLGAVCSNRVRFRSIWSNIYVMNLAPTGSGKSFPQSVISRLLDSLSYRQNLIGFGSYRSSTAFIKDLNARRERLDLLDEVSALFAQIKEGGVWQAEILEEMCKVWSASSGKYIAPEYASEKKDVATTDHPCVNILASSTIEGIKSNISKMMIVKGLLPRFLILCSETYGTDKGMEVDQTLYDDVVRKIDTIMKHRIPTRQAALINGGEIPDPVLFDTTPDSHEYFESLRKEYNRKVETESNETIKNMVTRGKEQVMKLSLIHAVSAGRQYIDTKDLVWARRVFEVSLHNSRLFLEESAVDGPWQSDHQKIISIFKKKIFLPKSKLGRLGLGIPRKRIMEHIGDLIEDGLVKRGNFQSPKGGRSAEGFKWTKGACND